MASILSRPQCINTLRPRRNEQNFADDIFKRIFFNENVWILIKISLKFVPKGPINNIPALVQIMAWRRSGDKPLSEPMMVSLPTHICVTRPQCVKPMMAWFGDIHLWVPRSLRITACSIKFKQFNIGMILFNRILDCLVLCDWLVVDWLIEINTWPSLLIGCINSLTPGRSGWNIKNAFFTLVLLLLYLSYLVS